jgi:hypothetical protein
MVAAGPSPVNSRRPDRFQYSSGSTVRTSVQELEQDGLMLGLFLEGAYTFVESPVRLLTFEDAADTLARDYVAFFDQLKMVPRVHCSPVFRAPT